MALGPELARRGHTVKVLCPSSLPPPRLEGVEVMTFGRSVPFPTAGSVARISVSVWHEPRLKATLEGEGFDIVHVHEPLMPLFSLMSVYLSQTVTIGTFHAFSETGGHGYGLWKPMLKRAAEKLHGKIAVSEAAREYASRYVEGDFTVIPNGVEVDLFSNPAPRPAPMRPDFVNLLFVGRVGDKRKGLRYLLGAYSTLKWEYPNLRLTVVGPGVPDAESYRIIGERNIQDVVFTGQLLRSELPAYYQHADIFCSPATGKESFGFVLLEAMAASRPIVASAIPGYQSVMRHGEQGLMPPPKDEKKLADAIRTLIEDRDLRARMGAASLRTAHRHDWSNVASQVLEFYSAVANGRAVPVGAA